MVKLVAAGVLAILLLTAGSMLLIYRLTEDPPGTVSARAEPVSAPVEANAGTLTQPQLGRDFAPTPADLSSPVPDVIPGDDPRYPGPVPNETAPIEGPAPMGLPTDPEERQDALDAVRKQRFSDQMERLNRRNEQRGGRPVVAVPPPPGAQPSRRRGALSADE